MATSALFRCLSPPRYLTQESEQIVTGMGDHVWGSDLTAIGRDPPGNVAWDQFLEGEEIRHVLTPTPTLDFAGSGNKKAIV